MGLFDRSILANNDQNNGQVSDITKLEAIQKALADASDENWSYLQSLVTSGTLNPLPPEFLNRQAIINGNFDVWQRGTSFTNPLNGSYTADRWTMLFNGSGQQHTVSRQNFTPGQIEVPNEPMYFFRYQVTTAAASQGWNVLLHLIESARTLAGQKVTLSFWAKADIARDVTITPYQKFGSGGTPSANSYAASKVIQINSSWQKFVHTFTLPSVGGKTFGTSGNDAVALEFGLPQNTIFTFDLAQFQLCAGDVALPVQPRSFAEELELCKRYYRKSFPYATAPTVNSGVTAGALEATQVVGASATQYALWSVRFDRTMRRAPTITLYSPSSASSQVRNNGTSSDFSNSVINDNSDQGFRIDAMSPAGSALGNLVVVHYAADAEL